MTYITSGALYCMKQLSVIKTNSVKNGCSFPLERHSIVPGIKNIEEKHNSVRKNLFLGACFGWDFRLSLRQMDQKYKFG